MEVALDLAGQAAARGEVPVGAVVVLDGEIVGQGANRTEALQDPTAHAEILALREAAGRLGSWRLTGATLYVTLEPCAMCAGALVLARIERLVFGADDPKAGMCGSLNNLVEDPRLNHRIEVVRGVAARQAGELLRGFFRGRRGASPAAPSRHEEPVREQTRHQHRQDVDPPARSEQEGKEPQDQQDDEGGPEHGAQT
jgi:tRNA(adenine34) deaminase